MSNLLWSSFNICRYVSISYPLYGLVKNRPGSDIVSAWASTSTATNTLTGTSMATPVCLQNEQKASCSSIYYLFLILFCLLDDQHAAGVAAMYLERDPSMTPAAVKAAMMSDGIPDVVKDPGDYSPNILLTTKTFFSTSNSAPSPIVAITPAPTPISESETTQTAAVCFELLHECKSNSDCCAGSCWLADWSLGFCAFALS